MILDNLNILIVNANIGSRSILREVIKSFLYRVKISYAVNLREAKKMLVEGAEINVGFVSFDFGQAEISEFISSLKAENVPVIPPFIATLRSRSENSTSDITSLYLEGIAGFISEPYSSNDILHLLSTITENKAKPEQKDKLKKASHLLLTEAIRQIDTLADNQAKKNEVVVGQTTKSLKTISKSLESLLQQDKEQYTQALFDAFENIAPPKTEQSVKKKKVVAKEIPHPGKVVADLMTQRKITIESLKHTLKMEPAEFQALLDGNLAINEVSSREVSRIFGKTSKEWLKMQADYDNYIALTKKQNEADQSE